ncbi:MAG TPA: PspC domain-containing protein [Bacteroidia bacterium]|nr:PspC domain-containing protein [Bacteroidia bacterium]MCW5919802.1 PspC domain-containing protein [Bacteroidota bacterium]MBP7713343.1 PspC domain-containing protein [Bacteroidia bacterium]MBP8667789.1 PspC domain-containing protein [Bacteroidia bacterium]MBX7238810.1 PspC domain-containing protein [Bacteroidia bacterium]
MDSIKNFFERQAFGICEYWGERLKIRSSVIRLFFIYLSFLTIGSPVVVYMVLGFWMNLRKLIHRQRGGVWDL